ncbi:MAG: hypothetical protein HOP23_02285 [Methylococcaceae bacterium]|nr:hypothetical protein [Methylococcaceae bacterium]
MTEKTTSKYLLNLEKHFANDSPVLLKAAKIFHSLDQVEYDLGLIESEETTACKNSWWPIISLIGGNSTAKSRFVNSYLGSEQLLSGIQASSHKFSVFLNNNQPNSTTLPGTALDVDPRYPFYQISRKLEQQQTGEGSHVNSYLEIKTVSSERLKGKLIIDAPNFSVAQATPVISFLAKHVVEQSDLIFVFTDTFDTPTPLVDELIQLINEHQDSNKFVYLIDAPSTTFFPTSNTDHLVSWQRKLADLGLNTGQIIVLPSTQSNTGSQNQLAFAEIDQRMANVAHDRTYRILNSLEKSISDIEEIVIPEVRNANAIWKERVNISSLVILAFIITLSLFAEINSGIVLSTLVDPILGPASLLIVCTFMIPVHIVSSRMHAKFIINQLTARQKELHLLENLSSLFEKNLTFSRMLLPLSEPAGWTKKTKSRLSQLSDKTKELVQSLNDSFGAYDEITGINSDPHNFKDFP